MKMNKSLMIVGSAALMLLSACKSADVEFPDFDYQTIYFANQTPVQTITLGEDGEFDVTMDNEHRLQILAVLGGVNDNNSNRWAEYVIDNSLVQDITFEDGTPVKAMPANYYEVTNESGRFVINKGKVLGGLDIHLTDAFFADPEAVNVCYVIPVRLTAASDSILAGKVKEGETPNLVDNAVWEVLPKNYTLYGIKYKNRWHGTWLSRGTVEVDNNGEKTTVTHQDPQGWWENEEVHYLTSKSLTQSHYLFEPPVAYTDAEGVLGEKNLSCDVILTINDNGQVAVSTDTEGCTVTGSGTYKYHGAGNAWGALERDLIELDFTYSIPYVVNEKTGATAVYKAHVVEKLVSRDRQSKFETFNYVMK